MGIHANPPQACDLCHEPIADDFYDFSVPGYGSWANGCPACFKEYGGRLGTGRGQHFQKNAEGVFAKVEG